MGEWEAGGTGEKERKKTFMFDIEEKPASCAQYIGEIIQEQHIRVKNNSYMSAKFSKTWYDQLCKCQS